MWRRFSSIVLSILVLFDTLAIPFNSALTHPIRASAETTYEKYYDQYRRSIDNRCSDLQEFLANTGSKQFGLLYQLRILNEYSTYVEFMIKFRGKDKLNCASDCQIYEMDLSNRVKSFNEKYASKSAYYKECKLDQNFTGKNLSFEPEIVEPCAVANEKGKIANQSHFVISEKAILYNVGELVPKYLESLLKDIQDDVNDAGSDTAKVKEVYAENTTILKNIYSVRNAVTIAMDDLAGYRPYTEKGERYKFVFKYKDKRITDIYDELTSKYSDLMKVGQAAYNQEETEEDISVDLTLPYAENLSDVVVGSDDIQIPVSPKLKRLYYAILAASSVYIPLQSYAGGSEFQTALKSLTNDDQEAAEIVEFYSAVKDMRKPLYKRELDAEKTPTGTAKLLTVQDFLDVIEEGKSGALCTVLGKFQYDSGTGAWIYYQGQFRNTVDYAYENVDSNSDSEIEQSTEKIETFESVVSYNLNQSTTDEFEENAETGVEATADPGFVPVEETTTNESSSDETTDELIGDGGDPTDINSEIGNGNLLRQASPEKSSDDAIGSDDAATGSGDANSDTGSDTGSDALTSMNDANANTDTDADASADANQQEKQAVGQQEKQEDKSFFKKMQDNLTSLFTKKAKATSVEDNTTDTSDTQEVQDTQEQTDASSSDASNADAENPVDTISNTAVYAYDTITDDTKLSEPVYLFGTDYYRDIDNLTAMLFYNAIKSSSNLKRLSDKDTRYLYVNPFGDIVTEDNLIVFPGVANPIMYKTTENYNPYTAAFMNTYPYCSKKNHAFKLINKNDIGKYIIVKQGSDKDDSAVGFYAVKTTSVKTIKNTDPIKVRKMYLNFSINGNEKYKLVKYNKLLFGPDDNQHDGSDSRKYSPLTNNINAMVNGTSVFPYVPVEDTGYEVAKSITKNMYWWLTSDAVKSENENSSRLNENYIIHYLILNGLDGTNNPKGYSRNSLEMFEKYVQGGSSRWLEKVEGLSDSILDFTAKAQGLIGLQDSLQSPLLGRILVACRTNLPYFALIIFIFLLIAFARMKYNLPQMAVKLIFSLFVAYLCITSVPTYMPMLFNSAINNIAEVLTYKTAGLRMEGESTDIVQEDLDKDGEILKNTGSLTLYRSGVSGYEELIRNANVDESEIVGGNVEVLNDSAGIYLEGDSIKINTSDFFRHLKIAGAKETSDASLLMTAKGISVDSEDTYQIKAYKTVSDSVDYYTPIYSIVDGFVNELNMFESVMQIPRSVVVYPNGVVKDNFLVYSFANSSVFLAPGEYYESFNSNGLSDDEIVQLDKEATTLAEDLEATFGNKGQATDFLRLSDWIYDPDDAQRKTLWFKTMQRNGYYGPDGKANTDRIDALVTYVNRQTKKFIFSLDDMIGRISDDTLIKLISLRATIAFNQKASEFFHWIYPFNLNYGDLTLKDLVSTAFISDYGKYTSMNLDVVDYIGETKGWFNLIIFDILLVLMFIISYIVQFLVPVMYLLLCVMLIYKLIAQNKLMNSVKGFMKCTVLLAVGYTFFAAGFVAVEFLNGSAIGIYAMLFVCLLDLYILFVVISSLVYNVADIGNAEISARLTGNNLGNAVKQTVNRMTTKNFSYDKNRNRTNYSTNTPFGSSRGRNYSKYAYSSSVGDMYRNSGYGSYGGYGNSYGNGYSSGYGNYGSGYSQQANARPANFAQRQAQRQAQQQAQQTQQQTQQQAQQAQQAQQTQQQSQQAQQQAKQTQQQAKSEWDDTLTSTADSSNTGDSAMTDWSESIVETEETTSTDF